ncbi:MULTISPECIES: ATP-independent periplasmic protein-refolding chaperone Spy [Tenebrionibacter/Tenebrionicola group]|jgi:protein CpxP|uniref:ATP-independent periplasmic protein-refolding chaperone n=2 Tax=Tenebrionibacter/Tenebrionicola group TaxID=2969848 RepID=A0A8K0V050_9ENTR|nr:MULTISPECIES: ATP-independent periplasmic protein-refolding chaperone Spy [Tenebrionibacter/Tenebrionicola group]MBK4714233.1 ATP-independent periplasmic protein-refolding chaperone [Tenebrionibacter intestinalis]MBV5094270.1 ATP-independent periplasmic protein-refolding chaperone Spy [Tenebrionicola larvae]
MRKLTAIIVTSALALGAANLAHAADSSTVVKEDAAKMQAHKGPRGPHMMMFNGLNLSDAQKQQVREIMKAEREKMTRHVQNDRKAMRDVVASDSFDRSKAQALIDSRTAGHKERMLSMLETQNKIYNILTPEQKKQFVANFDKMPKEPRGPHMKKPAADE